MFFPLYCYTDKPHLNISPRNIHKPCPALLNIQLSIILGPKNVSRVKISIFWCHFFFFSQHFEGQIILCKQFEGQTLSMSMSVFQPKYLAIEINPSIQVWTVCYQKGFNSNPAIITFIQLVACEERS